MASIKNEGIEPVRMVVTEVDARLIPDKGHQDPDVLTVRKYHRGLDAILGPDPTHALLLSSAATSRNPFFQGGCAYHPGRAGHRDELYATSGLLPPATNSSAQLPAVLISQVVLTRGDDAAVTGVEWRKLRSPQNMPNPAGVVCVQHQESTAASRGGGDGGTGRRTLYFCSQGTLSGASGGMFQMENGRPPTPVVTHWGGRPFNSPQQVAVEPAQRSRYQPVQERGGHNDEDGSHVSYEGQGDCLWFTDSTVGFETEIRGPPQLPCHIYRYDTATGVLRVMADGLARPGGIVMSPDGGTLYASDTAAQRRGEAETLTRPATVYAFDVIVRHDQPFLAQKRIFAYAHAGVPATLACDAAGNVYAACGDGVEIWSPGGVPLGLIAVPAVSSSDAGGGGLFGMGVFGGGGKAGGGGDCCCSTLCFGRRPGELFVGAGQRLWWVDLNTPQSRKGKGLSEDEMELV